MKQNGQNLPLRSFNTIEHARSYALKSRNQWAAQGIEKHYAIYYHSALCEEI
jgi:hypothetical protein